MRRAVTTSTNGTMSKEERDKLMSAAYTAAQKDLREAHQDEFNTFYQKECAERGIDWTPRKSPQDKALDDIVTLLQQYPDLAERLAAKIAEQSASNV